MADVDFIESRAEDRDLRGRSDGPGIAHGLSQVARRIADEARELDPVDRGLMVVRRIATICEPIRRISPDAAGQVGDFLREHVARRFCH